MKRKILTLLFAAAGMSAFAGSKITYTTSLTRNVNKTVEETTRFQANTDALCDAFNRADLSSLNTGIEAETIKILAKQGSGNSTYSSHSFGKYGFWFTAKGIATSATNTSRRIACKYENGVFKIAHYNDKVNEGDIFTFTEMFVQGSDTVQYVFNVTMSTADAIISTDQPAFVERIKHRADAVDSWKVKPSVRINEQTPMQQNYIQVMAGEDITLDCILPEGATTGRFSWKNRAGKSLQSLKQNSAWTIKQAVPEDAGYYVLSGRYTLDGKTEAFSNCYFYVDVQTEPLGSPFSWEGKCPQFSHDWKSDAKFNYGNYSKPEKVHSFKQKNGKAANQVVGEWWSAFWGDNLNAECGDAATAKKAAENMVKKYDEDFTYIRDYMGWPPDLSARDGYKSFVYVFGSGLSNDNTSKDEKGGYQGNTFVDGKNYACVWASYYPFSRFRDDADKKWNDGDYQREAMIHEGIHAIFADIVDNGFKSAWFHEAGNTWLQSAMNSERYDIQGQPGFLDACPFIAPFMPIECYSGWLQDGSFGGPSAEGVNMYGNNGQICTWRTLLGGTQYGNAFPIILGEIAGKGSIPYIWRNYKSSTNDYVLKIVSNAVGSEETMRQLIQQYRSRMALFDIGKWKNGYRSVTNGNFGTTIGAEWEPYWIKVAPFKLTMYQGLTKNSADGWLAPDTLTNPGWSGCNIIPIHVDSKVSTATVEFRPEDTEMRAQLCYTTKSGTNYYSQPVQCGKMQIDLTDRPANNVIFLVVCNTDYIYSNADNQAQRKKHYDYRVRFGSGALAVADLYTKWNLNEQTLTEKDYDESTAREENQALQELITGIEASHATLPTSYLPGCNGVKLISGMAIPGHPIRVQLSSGISSSDVHVSMLGISGIITNDSPLSPDCTYTLPSNLTPGLYFIKFTHHGKCDTYKVIVK